MFYRQVTPYDRLCYMTMEPGGEHLGSRVFFDCDSLMKEIMENMLDEETVREWQENLPTRLDAYAKQRRPVEDMDIG